MITTKVFKDSITSINIVESGTRSDHFLVKFVVSVSLKTSLNDTRVMNYRDFKSIVVEDFKADILVSDLCKRDAWCSESLDESVKMYNSILLELMDKHCPVISKEMKSEDKGKPWMDQDLKALQRQRRAAERAWRKGKGQKDIFVNLRNKFIVIERQKRITYNRKALLASAGDTKALYKKVYRLTGETTQERPHGNDTKKLAESFKVFFADKVNDIRLGIEEEGSHIGGNLSSSENLESTYSGPSFDKFHSITRQHLLHTISKMSNKFCSLDPIPTFMLKKCSQELAPILLHIINGSMLQGVFPAEMKTALVKPTIKKKNADPDILKNYRPVSNLAVMSKLIEKIVLEQLNNHLHLNSLHCPVQSGYRANHSCETLMVRMADDILKEVQKNNIVIVVLLDLSAAFDTIDHTILLKKLAKDFGIKDSALKWFSSYLSGRFFKVKVDDSLSDFLCLLFGVPQGSLLGPILFILYIKLLQEIARKYGLDIQLYADDSQLYIAFHPMRPMELQNVTSRINDCLSEIKVWMVNNFMKLNESKTELLVIGKPLVLKRFNLEITIKFGDTIITPTVCKNDTWKSLGVLLDESLNMERQINNVRKNCCWTMNNLRTIRKYLDERVKLMLVKQLIISKLDYCNALYMNLSKTRVKKLQSVLNAGIRFIYDIYDRNTDLSPFYKKAHILPVEKRIFFKVCLICFKVAHGLAPMYLQELVQMNRDDSAVKETRTKTACNLLMKIPKFSKLKATSRRFSNYAPESWNSLPLNVRNIDNIVSFKGKLKNYLYDQL